MVYELIRFIWIYIRPILGLIPFKYYKLITEWRRKKYVGRFGESINENTDLIIEAHARSGNSFAYHSFVFAQNRELNVAHHLHQPNHVIEAIKYNIPSIVIIRNPDDVVISYKIRSPHVTFWNAYYSYYLFYWRLKPYLGDIILATFEEITSNYKIPIERLNKKYKLNYNLYDNSTENDKKVFEIIETQMLKKNNKKNINEDKIARPSNHREKNKKSVSQNILLMKNSIIRKKTYELYEYYINYHKMNNE